MGHAFRGGLTHDAQVIFPQGFYWQEKPKRIEIFRHRHIDRTRDMAGDRVYRFTYPVKALFGARINQQRITGGKRLLQLLNSFTMMKCATRLVRA